MRNFLSYILSPVFYAYFGLLQAIFHPIQVGVHWILGDKARRKVVNVLNFGLINSMYLLASRIKFEGLNKIPDDRPIIIVSNHQSMFDIPAVVWGFRKCNPKFISKAELGKGLPSISYNLKHGKSALIERKNRVQSLKEIFKLGKLIEENNYGACIFPEGTRSRTGELKEFKSAGIETLVRAAPSAVIVPFVIKGHSQLMKRGKFPLLVGQRISYTVLDPIEPKGFELQKLVDKLHDEIKKAIN